MSPAKFREECEQFKGDMASCILNIKRLSMIYHFKLNIVVLDNGHDEFYPLKPMFEKENIAFLFFKDYIENKLHIKPEEMKKNYYWAIDMHYNSKGYNLLADGIAWKLKETGTIK